MAKRKEDFKVNVDVQDNKKVQPDEVAFSITVYLTQFPSDLKKFNDQDEVT